MWMPSSALLVDRGAGRAGPASSPRAEPIPPAPDESDRAPASSGTRPPDADRDEPPRPARHQGQPAGARDRLHRRLRGRGDPGRPGRRRPGLRSGDLITKLDGKSVLSGGTPERADRAPVAARAPADRAGGPARAQRHRARRVPPRQGPPDRLGRHRGRARHARRRARADARSPCGSIGTVRWDEGNLPAGDFVERFDVPMHRRVLVRLPAGPTSSWRRSTPIWASTSAPPRGSW